MTRTPIFRRGQRVTAASLNGLSRAIPEIRGGSGSLVRQSGNRVNIVQAQALSAAPAFIGRVIDAASVGPNKWEYAIEQIAKLGDKYGTITTGEWMRRVKAWNFMEFANTESGVQGNGVDVDQLPEGFSIGPVPIGDWPRPVYFWRGAGADGLLEYWLDYPNPIVGECPP